jgi:hypothetical protein
MTEPGSGARPTSWSPRRRGEASGAQSCPDDMPRVDAAGAMSAIDKLQPLGTGQHRELAGAGADASAWSTRWWRATLFTAPTIVGLRPVAACSTARCFVLGSGYALAKGLHIRSDFLYTRVGGASTQGLVDRGAVRSGSSCPTTGGVPVGLQRLWPGPAVVAHASAATETAWMPLLGPVKMLPAAGGRHSCIVQGVSEVLKAVLRRAHRESGRTNEPRIQSAC